MRASAISSSTRWAVPRRRREREVAPHLFAGVQIAASPPVRRSRSRGKFSLNRLCDRARWRPAGCAPSCMTASGIMSARPQALAASRERGSPVTASSGSANAARCVPLSSPLLRTCRFSTRWSAGLLADGRRRSAGAARVRPFCCRRGARARALREAFLRASGGKRAAAAAPACRSAISMPRSLSLGEAPDGEAGLDMPPAVPELRRRLLLTRSCSVGDARAAAAPLTAGQAAPLARELARFLDEVQSEGCDLAAARRRSRRPNYAEHWQHVLAFLAILTEHWPRLLAEIGCARSGGAAQPRAGGAGRSVAPPAAARTRSSPPASPAASPPSPICSRVVAALAARRRRPARPRPRDRRRELGRDRRRSGASAAPPGAAAAPARASSRPICARGRRRDRPAWPRGAAASDCRGAAAGGGRAIAGARLAGLDAAALDGLTPSRLRRPAGGGRGHRAAAAPQLEDAGRDRGAGHARPRPGAPRRRRAAPLGHRDRRFRRHAAQPHAARRLPAPGARRWRASDLAPVPLLAALKHPLAAGGMAPEAFRALVRRLEMAALRGPRPAPGFAGLRAALGAKHRGLARVRRSARERARRRCSPRWRRARRRSRTLVAAHIAAAEALAASDEESGAARLWRERRRRGGGAIPRRADRRGARFPAARRRRTTRRCSRRCSPAPVVRPRFGRHPRLAIWGLLEARLQQADLVVLGGLNEGIWPPQAGERSVDVAADARRSSACRSPERRDRHRRA